jgi:Putative transmembrane protein (PGPGW)
MMLSSLRQYGVFLEWLGILSVLTFTASVLLIPWLIALLPADYFIRERQSSHSLHALYPALRLILVLLRNFFGAFLLLAGIAMLFLPGQGILTILLGLSMLNFPGKHKLTHKLIQRPSVRHGLNWIRTKTNRPPFLWEREG